MTLEKIYNKINNGMSVTDAQFNRLLKHNKNLNAYVQKAYFNEDGTIDSVKYRIVPTCGTITPCKDTVYVV